MSALKIEIDLAKALTPAELESFIAQAEKSGRTVPEHAEALLFGERPAGQSQMATQSDSGGDRAA